MVNGLRKVSVNSIGFDNRAPSRVSLSGQVNFPEQGIELGENFSGAQAVFIRGKPTNIIQGGDSSQIVVKTPRSKEADYLLKLSKPRPGHCEADISIQYKRNPLVENTYINLDSMATHASPVAKTIREEIERLHQVRIDQEQRAARYTVTA